MANMIPDVRFAANTWVDLYALSSIAVGTSVVVVNKLDGTLLLWEGPTQPVALTVDGVPVTRPDAYKIATGATGLWASWLGAGQARVCVQVAT